MKHYDLNFKFKLSRIFGIWLGLCILFITPIKSFAAVVQRGTITTSRTVPRANTTEKISSVVTTTSDDISNEEEVIEDTEVQKPTPEVTVEIENKSSQFSSLLNNTTSNDTAANERAERIREQRAVLDAADSQTTAKKSLSSGKNSCDTNLRNCMKEKCGDDFSKCSGDGDTDWGNKLNSCKLNSECSGEEFTLFATEIKSDRDYNAQMSNYNQIIDCGNKFNSCITTQCDTDFSGCLNKSVADAAIATCNKVINNCKTLDSGLASRVQQVFGTLRSNATLQVPKDEARLVELRRLMDDKCKMMGATLDTRSLDCVFTVNLFANNSKTPMASKKLYGGDSFDCNQEWFGVDLTTFKENAYRATRSAEAASDALMGAGLGVATSMISSGMISDAVSGLTKTDSKSKETEKTEKKEKEAKEEKTTEDKDGFLKNLLSKDNKEKKAENKETK